MNNAPADFGLKTMDSEEHIALQGVTVATRIVGLLAETSLTQTYRNDRQTSLEVAYTFPLPVDAVLLAFRVKTGDRVLSGAVVPRRQAEVQYEQAIAKGDSAYRVQEIRPGIFSAALGNLLPGETIEIVLDYVETLVWNGSGIRYRLPTTLAPRYGDPRGFQPWQRPKTDVVAEYPLQVEVCIEGELARGVIACPSHKIRLRPTEGALTISLATDACMDRDFILEIEELPSRSLALAASACDTHLALLTLLPPEIENAAGRSRDVVLLLDCSGSMAGDSLRLAKEGVQLALGSLQPGERFALLGFGDACQPFDRELQPANRKNIEAARRFVDGLGNLGGTEMRAALEKSIAYGNDEPLDILLLTDGQAWELDSIMETACARGIRIFTLGIGSSVAEDTVKSLADKTGGMCELVSPNEDMAARIYRHFRRMRQPEATGLDIRWPAEPLWEQRPERGCFAGDSWTVMAAFAEPPAGAVQVSYEYAGLPPFELEVPLALADKAGEAIVRVSARQRLIRLPAAEQQDWAVRYQLLSEETDYLIVHERAAGERAEALPELAVVPQMLPAGWGNTSTVLDSPVLFYCRSSLAVPELDTNICFEMPAVVRKRFTVINHKAWAYLAFIEQLNARAQKLLRRLPDELDAIRALGLPPTLAAGIDEQLAQGTPARAIVLALYRALLDHQGCSGLSKSLVSKAEKLLAGQTPDPALVEVLQEALDALWQEAAGATPDDSMGIDIPAFLRKYAD